MKILIADDAGYIKQILSHILTQDGHEIVGFANTGTEAIQFCNDLQPELLFLDLVMPERNGLEVAGEILQKYPQLPIIICTSLDQSWVKEKAMALGCIYYLQKPFSKKDVLLAIQAANPKEGRAIYG